MSFFSPSCIVKILCSGLWTFRILRVFCRMNHFIMMERPPLSLVTIPSSESYFDWYFYSYFSLVLFSVGLIHVFISLFYLKIYFVFIFTIDFLNTAWFWLLIYLANLIASVFYWVFRQFVFKGHFIGEIKILLSWL